MHNRATATGTEVQEWTGLVKTATYKAVHFIFMKNNMTFILNNEHPGLILFTSEWSKVK